MRRPLSDREIVEVFHLQFVRILASGSQRGQYAIKGGCNLRFFFDSIRYSEDIDFDVEVTAPQTLGKHVDGILESQPLTRLLRAHGITVAGSSKPKQTETTQRWNLTLTSTERTVALHTKIEFSRRATEDVPQLDPVDPKLLDGYGLARFVARHYPAAIAMRQKIGALAGRKEPQARDVFDLDLLLAGHRNVRLGDVGETAAQALERAMALSYDEYASQVVAYLMPEHASLYESKSDWEAMQLRVVEFLEEQRP